MSSRTASSLAWFVWELVALSLCVVLVMGAGADFGASDLKLYVFLIFVVTFSTVGALTSSRMPARPMGWFKSGTALSYVIGGASLAYSESALGDATAPLVVTVVNWSGSWAWNLGIGLAIFLLLLLPNRRFPSPRWRFVAAINEMGRPSSTRAAPLLPVASRARR